MAHADQAVAASIMVEVAFSPEPRVVECAQVQLSVGARVQDALHACGLFGQVPSLTWDAIHSGALALGIWGRRATLDQGLRDKDRVEIYRFLRVDPKEARRQRYRAHGEKLPKGIHRPKDRSNPGD